MRTRNEITNKIDALMELLGNVHNPQKSEQICNQIDALLWVIGDRSGGQMLDEMPKSFFEH